MLESRIRELEAQLDEVVPEQHSQTFAGSGEQAESSADPRPTVSTHNHQNPRPLFNPSAGSEIQTPITIQASSLDFNIPAASTSNQGFLGPPSANENLETITPQGAEHQVTSSDLRTQSLIQTYLERVNPRYPFLHEETFLGWYQSWREFPRDALPAEDQWKCFFIKMAFAVGLLIAAKISPEERQVSNVSKALLQTCAAINREEVTILDCPIISQGCLCQARSRSTCPGVSDVYDTCTSLPLLSHGSYHDLDDYEILRHFAATSINLRAGSTRRLKTARRSTTPPGLLVYVFH